MSRSLRIALTLQAVSLTVPIIVTGYWSWPRPCTGEVCINMAPAFLVAVLVLFGLPLLLIVWFATRRELSRGDLWWVVGVDVFVVAGSVLVIVLFGSGSYVAMGGIVATAIASAAIAASRRRRAISIGRNPMDRRFRVALYVQAATLVSPFVVLAVNGFISPQVCSDQVCDQSAFFHAFGDVFAYGIPVLVVLAYAFGNERLDGAGLAFLLAIDGWLLVVATLTLLTSAGQLIIATPAATIIAAAAITAIGAVIELNRPISDPLDTNVRDGA